MGTNLVPAFRARTLNGAAVVGNPAARIPALMRTHVDSLEACNGADQLMSDGPAAGHAHCSTEKELTEGVRNVRDTGFV
jgi:hypothetical protein